MPLSPHPAPIPLVAVTQFYFLPEAIRQLTPNVSHFKRSRAKIPETPDGQEDRRGLRSTQFFSNPRH